MSSRERLRNLQKQFVFLGEKYLHELQHGKSKLILEELAGKLARLTREIEELQVERESDSDQSAA